DGHAGSEIALHDVRIDVGPRQKGEHDGADARDVIDPIGQLQTDRIAGDRADYNFEQGRRDRDVEGSDRGNERQRHPYRRLKPDVVHYLLLCPCRAMKNEKPALRRVTKSPAARNAAGVISSAERFWGTPIPIRSYSMNYYPVLAVPSTFALSRS